MIGVCILLSQQWVGSLLTASTKQILPNKIGKMLFGIAGTLVPFQLHSWHSWGSNQWSCGRGHRCAGGVVVERSNKRSEYDDSNVGL